MAITLFFCMVLRKFSEITNNKLIFSQYNIFCKYKYFFFQYSFWSLFNHCEKVNQIRNYVVLCCSSPCFRVLLCTHYGPLPVHIFGHKKKSEFYGPYFQTMLFFVTMISGAIHSNNISEIKILSEYFRNMYPCHRCFTKE